MNSLLKEMLKQYEIDSLYQKKHAIKEILQEIILCGLSRAGFFKHAAFYGGTALRIFYGLNRFSEDLDFSLKAPFKDFAFSSYFSAIKQELQSFGLEAEVEEKKKTLISDIQSAFVKGDTEQHLLVFYGNGLEKKVTKGEKIKIKLEIDANPPEFADFEYKYRLLPNPYQVTLYDPPSLLAGKTHAVLCRAWKNRVKGRDLYDYVFFLSRNTPINLKHLQARLIQNGHIKSNDNFSIANLKETLCEHFEKIDYELAKADVMPFILDKKSIELWNADFFKQITESYLSSAS